MYQLTFEARDNNNAPPNQQRKTPGYMNVHLLDVNDNAPQFERMDYAASIKENINPGESILTIMAHDPDEGENGIIDFSLDLNSRNVTEGLFQIHRSGGEIYVQQSLKGTFGTYYMDVIAQDRGKPQMKNSTRVLITIEDVNDHAPTIVQPPENATIVIPEVNSYISCIQ